MKTRIKPGLVLLGLLAGAIAIIYFVEYTHALDFIR
jgi:hypothetical protein